MVRRFFAIRRGGPIDRALSEFCAREYPRVLGALSLYCGSRAVGEELAQEAMVRLCERWDDVRQMSAPGAWLHRVGINLANSHFRRWRAERRALRRRGAQGEIDVQGDTADAVAIREAIAELPVRRRTALVLRHFLDLPVSQVAEMMEMTPGSVRVSTHRALEDLRERLGIDLAADEEGADVP